MARKKTIKKPAKKPRQGQFQEGNKLSRLADHSRDRTRDFISQRLIACLNQAPKVAKAKKGEKEEEPLEPKLQTRYAQMVDKLVDMAIKGDRWAIEFIFERVEGKVTQPIIGQIDHYHTIEDALPLLSKTELAVFETAARKVLVGHPKVIDHQPN